MGGGRAKMVRVMQTRYSGLKTESKFTAQSEYSLSQGCTATHSIFWLHQGPRPLVKLRKNSQQKQTG